MTLKDKLVKGALVLIGLYGLNAAFNFKLYNDVSNRLEKQEAFARWYSAEAELMKIKGLGQLKIEAEAEQANFVASQLEDISKELDEWNQEL